MFKMNKIVNKFLLVGNKFKAELYLRQPGFTYSACELFTKHRERIEKFREAGNLKHINKNCFGHDVVYSDSKIFS